MIVLQILGSLIGLIILYLIVIIFFPVMKVAPQPMKTSTTKKEAPENREDIEYYVDDIMVSGWYYTPTKNANHACVIFSHGLCGTKDMELEKYAIKFTNEGYAVLLYDYRYFGESGGEPRQLFGGTYQYDDLKGAIKYARSRDDVDEDKIFLWGTSAGAGYGVSIASEDDKIAGVIAQCGAYDHKEDNQMYFDRLGIAYYLKLFIHGQRDKGRSRFGLSVHKFPAYGKEGTIAVMAGMGIYEGIQRLAENSTTFKNELCGRVALLPHAPDSTKRALEGKCKVMVLVCKNDMLVSPKTHIRMVENLGERAVVKKYDSGHFDIYFGDLFEKATNDQLDFFGNCI
ncbi:MAG: alpha/beta fold hydrolase [Anaerolineaceae bacterium]|nr:alpha/beta fold hydrolase [Anaerolineaceae bacterium]